MDTKPIIKAITMPLSRPILVWDEPDSTSIQKVWIYKSSTYTGSFSAIASTNATNDGAPKTSSNSWVTTYTDSSGLRTDWYELRFYSTTSNDYSNYSNPVSAWQKPTLCTTIEVKRFLDTVGRWTDTEILDVIEEVDELIYLEAGRPIQSSWSEMGKINSTVQTRYYVGEEDIYRVDRVFYGTTTKEELFIDDGYRSNTRFGMVEILPVASSGVTPSVDSDIEMHYVPGIYNKLAIWRTIVRLLEKLDMVSGGTSSKELDVVQRRLDEVETLLINKYTMLATGQMLNYDKKYGVNRKHVVQNHDRNRYLGSTGWT